MDSIDDKVRTAARCLPSQGTLNLLFSAQEDMQFADEAFDILGFTSEEKYNVYKVSRRERERESDNVLSSWLTFICWWPGGLSRCPETDYLLTFKAFKLSRGCVARSVP